MNVWFFRIFAYQSIMVLDKRQKYPTEFLRGIFMIMYIVNPKILLKHNTSAHAFSEKEKTHDEVEDGHPDLYNRL